MKKLMMAVMVVSLGLSAAAAYTPSFAYQGVLRDQWGNPLGSDQENVGITFRVYNSPNGDDYLWSKYYTVSLATNGLFNVELSGAGTTAGGVSTTLDKVVAENANAELHIGLTVADSAGEITPRQKLIPAPRALFAQDVQTAKGDFTVKGNLTVAGTIAMASTNAVLEATSVRSTGPLYADGAATLNGGAQVGGALTVSGGLTVDGVQMSMPIGAIILWAGVKTNIPDGWQLCDGAVWQGAAEAYVGSDPAGKTVPDLQENFVGNTLYIIKVK